MRTILGVVIVVSLLLVAVSSLGVVREALRLKRRLTTLKDQQLFLAVGNAQTEMLHLQRSVTMLNAQFVAVKAALDHIRESLTTIRSMGLGEELAQLKRAGGSLLRVLR